MTESERETLTTTDESITQNKSPQRGAHNKISNLENVKMHRRPEGTATRSSPGLLRHSASEHQLYTVGRNSDPPKEYSKLDLFPEI